MTAREQEVLDLLCEGLVPKQIAREMHLSVHTVRDYIQALRHERGAGSVHHLVALELQSRCACR